MRAQLIALLAIALPASCVTPKINPSVSPPDGVAVNHFKDGGSHGPHYVISDGTGSVLGKIPSIIDQAVLLHVPGVPVEHSVSWSPTGRTAAIYENMSVASPDYAHMLIRWNPGSGNYDVYRLDPGIRPQNVGYSLWPHFGSVTDHEIELLWPSEPQSVWVPICKLSLELVATAQ